MPLILLSLIKISTSIGFLLLASLNALLIPFSCIIIPATAVPSTCLNAIAVVPQPNAHNAYQVLFSYLTQYALTVPHYCITVKHVLMPHFALPAT